MEILISVLVAVIIILLSIFFYQLYKKRKKRHMKNQWHEKAVIIKAGINIKEQMPGVENGEYFTGGLKNLDTYCVSGSSSFWNVSFFDLESGAMYKKRFRGQLWIGRVPEESSGEPVLALQEDSQISRRHCLIYESSGRLCIVDNHSKNHTFLNGKQIEAPVFLHRGDIVRIGASNFKIEFEN